MKRLVLLGVLSMAACGSSGRPAAAFSASWSITEGGNPSICEAVGGDTVTFDFQRRATGDVDTFIFNCQQGLNQFVESAAALVTDRYDVTVTLWHMFELPGEQLLGTVTLTVDLVAPVNQLPTIAFAFSAPSGGVFDLAWTIVNASGPDTCAAVGADTFAWTVTNLTSGLTDTFLYNCSDMAVATDPLPLGTYDATAELRAGSQVLGSVSATDLVLDTSLLIVPTFAFSFN